MYNCKNAINSNLKWHHYRKWRWMVMGWKCHDQVDYCTMLVLFSENQNLSPASFSLPAQLLTKSAKWLELQLMKCGFNVGTSRIGFQTGDHTGSEKVIAVMEMIYGLPYGKGTKLTPGSTLTDNFGPRSFSLPAAEMRTFLPLFPWLPPVKPHTLYEFTYLSSFSPPSPSQHTHQNHTCTKSHTRVTFISISYG